MQTQEWAKIWGWWVDKNAVRLKHYIVEDGASDDAWHERIAALYDRLFRWIREHGDINMLTFGTIDRAFDALVEMGLEKNPTELTEKEKQAQAEAEAQEELVRRDVHYQWFYDTHSNQQNAEEARRNSDYGKWLDNEKRAGVKVPEAPSSNQASLFIVRSIDNGVIRYIASDGLSGGAVVLAAKRENAFPFGNSRARYFAGLLAKQRPGTVDVIPLNAPARSPEMWDEPLNEYAGQLHREIFERERQQTA